jgi:hypothetical protein
MDKEVKKCFSIKCIESESEGDVGIDDSSKNSSTTMKKRKLDKFECDGYEEKKIEYLYLTDDYKSTRG